MKHTIILTIASLGLLSAATTVTGDEWFPAESTTYTSQNGLYQFTVSPCRKKPFKPGYCFGRLIHMVGKFPREVWSRYLINDEAPFRAFVSDSGWYVVTMDEWGRIGHLPFVVYGNTGHLINVHNEESLGILHDIMQIEISVSSFWWDKDAICFFGPRDETFFVRLHWGRLLIFSLRSGNRLDQKEDSASIQRYTHLDSWQDFVKNKVREHALILLDSNEPEERKTGALVCGQEKFEKSVTRLKELLVDTASYSTNIPKEWTRVYFVRKAAKEALDKMGQKTENIVIEEPENR